VEKNHLRLDLPPLWPILSRVFLAVALCCARSLAQQPQHADQLAAIHNLRLPPVKSAAPAEPAGLQSAARAPTKQKVLAAPEKKARENARQHCSILTARRFTRF